MTRHLAALTGSAVPVRRTGGPGTDDPECRDGGADVGQLDPHRATTTQDKPVPPAWIFNGLARFAPGSSSLEELEPDLAEKWESLPRQAHLDVRPAQGREVPRRVGRVDRRRRGVRATPRRRQQVVVLRRRLCGLRIDRGGRPVDGPHIKLKQAIRSLLGLVTNYHGGNIVSRKAVEALGADFRLKPVGTGPFSLTEHKPNESINAPTWRQGRSPAARAKDLDRIVHRFIPADSSPRSRLHVGRARCGRWPPRTRNGPSASRKEPGVVVDVLRPSELLLGHPPQHHHEAARPTSACARRSPTG